MHKIATNYICNPITGCQTLHPGLTKSNICNCQKLAPLSVVSWMLPSMYCFSVPSNSLKPMKTPEICQCQCLTLPQQGQDQNEAMPKQQPLLMPPGCDLKKQHPTAQVHKKQQIPANGSNTLCLMKTNMHRCKNNDQWHNEPSCIGSQQPVLAPSEGKLTHHKSKMTSNRHASMKPMYALTQAKDTPFYRCSITISATTAGVLLNSI